MSNKVNIKYPFFKGKGHPTPCSELRICDKCGHSGWFTPQLGRGNVVYCESCSVRMRVATKEEHNEALKCVELEV